MLHVATVVVDVASAMEMVKDECVLFFLCYFIYEKKNVQVKNSNERTHGSLRTIWSRSLVYYDIVFVYAYNNI